MIFKIRLARLHLHLIQMFVVCIFVCLKSSVDEDLKGITVIYSVGLASQNIPPFFALGKLIMYHIIPAAVVAWEAVQTE